MTTRAHVVLTTNLQQTTKCFSWEYTMQKCNTFRENTRRKDLTLFPLQYEKMGNDFAFVRIMVVDYPIHFWKASQTMKPNQASVLVGRCRQAIVLCGVQKWDVVHILREDINRKKTFSFGHCPKHLNPPPLTPIRATWSFFFGLQNLRFASHLRKVCKNVGRGGRYINNLKNS